jgi:hypothetical protein
MKIDIGDLCSFALEGWNRVVLILETEDLEREPLVRINFFCISSLQRYNFYGKREDVESDFTLISRAKNVISKEQKIL